MRIEEELANYLKEDGFQRFVEKWIHKYQSLGHLGGQVVLNQLNFQEQEAIGGLLGLDLKDGYLRLTYQQLERCLNATRFEGADLLQVFELLKEDKIYTKQETKRWKESKLIHFKDSLKERFKNTFCIEWLNDYLDNDKLVNRFYQDSPQEYEEILNFVCDALNQLPIHSDNIEGLAIFAQKITKNPHYFDEDLPKELLLRGINDLFQLQIDGRSSLEMNELLEKGGLLKDECSNYCYICHLLPNCKPLSWLGFFEEYEPWNLNLFNLNKVKGNFVSMPVFVVENPSVFYQLCTFVRKNKLNAGLISSNGQINICTYLLLDRLVDSGCSLYYAGDYDPEGLLIADKLKERYQEKLVLWCYDEKLFEKICIHQLEVSNKRIQMLKSLKSEELLDIASMIEKMNSFGYQEGLVNEYMKQLLELK